MLAALVLVLGAAPALADDGHDAAEGHVHLVDGGGGCSSGCPHRPTGYAVPGPGAGEITLHWTPATTGAAVSDWSVWIRRSDGSTHGFAGRSGIDASTRSWTIRTLRGNP